MRVVSLLLIRKGYVGDCGEGPRMCCSDRKVRTCAYTVRWPGMSEAAKALDNTRVNKRGNENEMIRI